MALATTTLASALAAADDYMSVASATSVTAGRLVRIDDEWMQVRQDYSSGTSIPVLRGRNGSAVVAHVITANVTHGLASDFSDAPAGASAAITVPSQRATRIVSITATGSLSLPKAGEDLRVILNGTSVIALTVPVPTKDLDGCLLYIGGNGVAAHTVTFTGGLSGAGGSYDIITVNASAQVLLGPFMAVNGLWLAAVAVPMAGTVTNITATVA
jgi:hypothetical protein